MNARSDIPMACVPGAIGCDARPAHFGLIDRLFKHDLLEQNELENGLAFRFATEHLESLGRFIANERKCCPFLRFELTLEPGADSAWLRLTGAPGTAEILRAELALSI